MKKIKLAKGKFALVDDEDYDWLNQWKWYANKIGHTYYVYHAQRIGKKILKYAIHRIIMRPPFNMQVDHIDHNGLNNQKSNLRICNSAQNQMNQLKKNKYKGVYIEKRCNKNLIRACIKINYTLRYLGYFKTEKEAAMAYNEAAKNLFGEFANLNIL